MNDLTAVERPVIDVTVYSRPGCPYCLALRAGLRRRHVEFREVNIWADSDAAAFVRSVAGGNETVPTVSVGDVHLVNPTARQVHTLVARASDGAEPVRRSRTLRRRRDGAVP